MRKIAVVLVMMLGACAQQAPIPTATGSTSEERATFRAATTAGRQSCIDGGMLKNPGFPLDRMTTYCGCVWDFFTDRGFPGELVAMAKYFNTAPAALTPADRLAAENGIRRLDRPAYDSCRSIIGG